MRRLIQWMRLRFFTRINWAALSQWKSVSPIGAAYADESEGWATQCERAALQRARDAENSAYRSYSCRAIYENMYRGYMCGQWLRLNGTPSIAAFGADWSSSPALSVPIDEPEQMLNDLRQWIQQPHTDSQLGNIAAILGHSNGGILPKPRDEAKFRHYGAISRMGDLLHKTSLFIPDDKDKPQ